MPPEFSTGVLVVFGLRGPAVRQDGDQAQSGDPWRVVSADVRSGLRPALAPLSSRAIRPRRRAEGQPRPVSPKLPRDLICCRNRDLSRHRKPERMQQFLKPPARAAGAEVVAPELLHELLLSADHAEPELDTRLGRESLPSLATGLERKGGRRAGSSLPSRTSLGCGAASRLAELRFLTRPVRHSQVGGVASSHALQPPRPLRRGSVRSVAAAGRAAEHRTR